LAEDLFVYWEMVPVFRPESKGGNISLRSALSSPSPEPFEKKGKLEKVIWEAEKWEAVTIFQIGISHRLIEPFVFKTCGAVGPTVRLTGLHAVELRAFVHHQPIPQRPEWVRRVQQRRQKRLSPRRIARCRQGFLGFLVPSTLHKKRKRW